ncbi:MAG: CADD family putative folate metabolism protein [Acidobacteria bacterium]|nr:CADD family putative folate metabolism protein [Acidobacteriota bacterium]MBV9069353.1 CADD family putative folate metabolism protein [Acidobacteriota bacterium]MBV9187155.1 CADD family putative folate metabolism protein [Acidobacteriota bacterium]
MTGVIKLLDSEINERHMLNHPFYQRWNAGELTRGELEEYSRQYYPYTLAFPTFLSAMHAHTDDIAIRQYLLENLIEEERGAENHPELWLRFCDALGVDRSDAKSTTPNAATSGLITTMRNLAHSEKLHEGLAALYAYESQIPAVSKTKIDGLAAWYGITKPRDISFFSVHMEADVLHSQTARELLETLCDTPEKCEEAREAAATTVNALYRFLDAVN